MDTDSSQKQTSVSKAKGIRWWFEKLLTPLLVFAAGLLVVVVTGLAQRVGWISVGTPSEPTSVEAAGVEYTCPMHPHIRQPNPGRCPICGMELVAAGASGSNIDELSVQIEPAQRRLANIATHEVKLEPVALEINSVGSIAVDESRMATIASYVDGRIERLFADYTGVTVAKGDHLAVVYSGELYSAQVEYLDSRQAVANSPSALPAVRQALEKFVANGRRKLAELGLTEEQILELEESGTAFSRQTFFAPIGGTVVEKLVVEGKYIKAGEPIYRIADLSTVWMKLELFPEDASKVRFGQLVKARLDSLPGEILEGRITFVDPTVNERKRTVGVRVEFSNVAGKLRPGDYADATIQVPIQQTGEVYDAGLAGKWISPMHPQIIRDESGDCPICGMPLVPTSSYGYSQEPVPQSKSVWVPRSAVLMAGDHSIAYVETKPGRFEIRELSLGPILRDKVVVVQGLEAGEKVATSGNFLIDSQMQLAGKPSLIDPSRASANRSNNSPLDLKRVQITRIGGETGDRLESLYEVYFKIHSSLANDQKPSPDDALSLYQTAKALANDDALSKDAQLQLSQIAKHAEHLHHMEIDSARLNAFRPISHAVLELAATIRGQNANTTFHQMFCPMVEGGSGDWLQSSSELRNPYFGSQMLQCGEVVRSFPAEGAGKQDAATTQQDGSAHDHGGHE
ncbi:MAG: efflux RND transporter periplasmic adaptor subunit [Planctomycetales bacterium]|nr:efflux RND transporter periplasmic adaptor subunit [Planctomycetales bacterium]